MVPIFRREGGAGSGTFGWRRLVNAADVPVDRVLVVRASGRLIGMVGTSGRIFVFDGRCSHAGQSLHGAPVTDEGAIVCPRHGLKVAVGSAPCRLNAMPVTSLPFRVRDGAVEVPRTWRRTLLRRDW